MTGYSGKRAAEAVGITYRQLDYWARTGLVGPSIVAASGSGSRRTYSFADLVLLRVVKDLADAGVGHATVRLLLDRIQHLPIDDLAAVRLVLDSRNVTVVDDDVQLLALVRAAAGVVNVVDVRKSVDSVTRALSSSTAAPNAPAAGTFGGAVETPPLDGTMPLAQSDATNRAGGPPPLRQHAAAAPAPPSLAHSGR